MAINSMLRIKMDIPNFIFEKCGKANVVFTSRVGGFSKSPYDSLNVAKHVGDEIDLVERNRKTIFSSLEKFDLPQPEEWIFLNQTHCDQIFQVDEQTYDQLNPPTADGSITTLSEIPLVVMVADCGPLIISCGNITATVHASVKTVSLDIIGKTINLIRNLDQHSEIYALLGPCIHSGNYEYAQDDLDNYSKLLGSHVVSKTNDSKPAFNLPEAIKYECEKFKVNFRDINIDTFSNNNYFSYRRDAKTGRQCVISWMSK